MNFKAYDILSSLIPGFTAVLVSLYAFDIEYSNNLIVPYTAIAFLFGFLMNTLSSWMEDLFFLTWNGKPSSRLLAGKDIWKVRFYEGEKVKNLLLKEWNGTRATNDQLFAIAMRRTNGQGRTEDFNALYAFSRSLLATVFIGTVIILIKNPTDWKYYAITLPSLFVVWLRCKQRAYYYTREVLNEYLKTNHM